ncbi:MAG TPA: PTS fructose IIA subunit family protein [Rhodanobacteraceae bacterium]|nr:PTS fructose IIA subunit family protein [Rhodanobacteraceae bacterium]
MAVGILLMTHEAIGPALVKAARHVLGKLPLPLDTVEVPADSDPTDMLRQGARHARALDHGDGVLVLTDVFGATPCNIARRMDELGVHQRCVPGLNLPMLLRVLNYADRPLEELAEVAASGGRSGIFVDKG